MLRVLVFNPAQGPKVSDRRLAGVACCNNIQMQLAIKCLSKLASMVQQDSFVWYGRALSVELV